MKVGSAGLQVTGDEDTALATSLSLRHVTPAVRRVGCNNIRGSLDSEQETAPAFVPHAHVKHPLLFYTLVSFTYRILKLYEREGRLKLIFFEGKKNNFPNECL